MKPFDLEAAKAGKPIQQRDGTKMRFIAHVPDANECSRIIVMNEHSKLISHRAENGSYPSAHERLDLFMAPTKKVYWANVWRARHGVFAGELFTNETEAISSKKRLDGTNYKHLKTIQIEIEE